MGEELDCIIKSISRRTGKNMELLPPVQSNLDLSSIFSGRHIGL
jgi:hypothetical protein